MDLNLEQRSQARTGTRVRDTKHPLCRGLWGFPAWRICSAKPRGVLSKLGQGGHPVKTRLQGKGKALSLAASVLGSRGKAAIWLWRLHPEGKRFSGGLSEAV